MSFFRQFPKTVYDFQSDGIDTQVVDLFRSVKVQNLYSDDLSIYTYYNINNGERPDILSNTLYGTPEYYWTFFVVNDKLKSGLSEWPMSAGEFDAYMDQEYAGTVIQTYPQLGLAANGVSILYTNSLAGPDMFHPGDRVQGVRSGANGFVVSTDVQLSQLLLRDVTDGSGGAFFKENGTENLVYYTGTNDRSVTIAKVFSHRDAPHHYEDADGLITYTSLSINEGVSPSRVLTTVSNYEYEMQLNDERANLRIVRPEAIYNFAKTFRELINA